MTGSTTPVNPLLPSWEYVPDGEPRVFGDRLYLYGSHDRFGGTRYCENDYVVWSAPLDDLSDWRLHGTSYRRTQDPANRDGKLRLYAPDVVRGVDGRFYLYYCLVDHPQVGVAVSDEPAGPFEFHGLVRDAEGNPLGSRPGDTHPFDPAVLVEGSEVWLYTGSGPLRPSQDRKKRQASVVTGLAADMTTVIEPSRRLIPTVHDSAGTGFEGREFFEASSIRHFGDFYYFIYSSVLSHELCWARSSRPDEGFEFGGRLISNGDLRPEEDAPGPVSGATAKRARNYLGNNHGSVEMINGEYYVFHHRHTGRSPNARQACAEPIVLDASGRFEQAELTSSGVSRVLPGSGRFDARIASHLSSARGASFSHRLAQRGRHPAFTQSLPDREHQPDQHIVNLREGASATFRYFEFTGVDRISVRTRGSGRGALEVRDLDDRLVAELPVSPSVVWVESDGVLDIADGIGGLSFTFRGRKAVDFLDFTVSSTGESSSRSHD